MQKLQQQGIIELHLFSNDSKIIFNEPREDDYTINRISKHLNNQNQLKIEKFEAILAFVNDKKTCKSVLISNYFGEENETACGICSTCLQQKQENLKDSTSVITNLLQKSAMTSQELQHSSQLSNEALIFALQTLLENDIIFLNQNKKYQIK